MQHPADRQSTTGAPDAAAIVALALRRTPTLGSTRLICLDGPAGSGKTTLADAVVAHGQAEGLTHGLIHMDDLYEGWAGLDLGVEPRLLEQVIGPLAVGSPARWQRYDWHAGRFGAWVDQPPVEVLVIEGCGSGALAYAPFRTVLTWVEADRQTRIQRGIERDGEQVLPYWLAWMDSEARHFAANETEEHADLRYSTGTMPESDS